MHASRYAACSPPGKRAAGGLGHGRRAAQRPLLRAACRYNLLRAGGGSSLAGELRHRQLGLRPGEPANIQFTSGGWAVGWATRGFSRSLFRFRATTPAGWSSALGGQQAGQAAAGQPAASHHLSHLHLGPACLLAAHTVAHTCLTPSGTHPLLHPRSALQALPGCPRRQRSLTVTSSTTAQQWGRPAGMARGTGAAARALAVEPSTTNCARSAAGVREHTSIVSGCVSYIAGTQSGMLTVSCPLPSPQGVRACAALPLLWLSNGQPGRLRARRHRCLSLGWVPWARAGGQAAAAAARFILSQPDAVPRPAMYILVSCSVHHRSRVATLQRPGGACCAAPPPLQTASTQAPRCALCSRSGAPRSSECPPCLQWSWSSPSEQLRTLRTSQHPPGPLLKAEPGACSHACAALLPRLCAAPRCIQPATHALPPSHRLRHGCLAQVPAPGPK